MGARKWGIGGRAIYRLVEPLSVRWASALIADARGIAEYGAREFGVETELITHGTQVLADSPSGRLEDLGLVPGRFISWSHGSSQRITGTQSWKSLLRSAALPLVVVGSAPYAAEYTDRTSRVAASDARIRRLGGVFDQEFLYQLYANSLTYLHGHSGGGTNPSLSAPWGRVPS